MLVPQSLIAGQATLDVRPPPKGLELERTLAPLRDLARNGGLDFPLPGSGATIARLESLVAWGRFDVAAARLVEAHADAQAILDELEHPVPRGLLGVWAAEDPAVRLAARRGPSYWELTGVKRWCSGARLVDAALVTAHTDEGRRLFLVPTRAALTVRASSWATEAMARTDTRDVSFDALRLPIDAAIGAPGAYLDRPGFWHGATGVAACWHGGALGLADALLAAARDGRQPHRDAHLGAVEAALTSSAATLRAAAEAIDCDPNDKQGAAERWAFTARAVVERAAGEVIERVGRALGPAPLAHDAAHARRAADWTLDLRQSHAERDLEHLGELVAATS